MRCDNSTMYAMYVDTVDAKHIHTFLPITFLIFNQFSIQKKFSKAETKGFQPCHQYYICQYSQYKTRISNAFNAIYVNTVDTKHIYTFLPITFLIFNQFSIHKKFGMLRLRVFQPYHQYYIYVNTVNTRQGSLIHSLLSTSTLSMQNMKVCNVFNAIYVDTVNTKH